MKRRYLPDLFFIVFLLSFFLVIGMHIGEDKTSDERCYFQISVSPTKISGAPDESSLALIDGKLECRVIRYGEDEIVLICAGYITEAGYLLYGSKYVSKNQPIKAIQPWGYFEGRIYKIATV